MHVHKRWCSREILLLSVHLFKQAVEMMTIKANFPGNKSNYYTSITVLVRNQTHRYFRVCKTKLSRIATSSTDDGICPSHYFFIIFSPLHDSYLNAFSPANTELENNLSQIVSQFLGICLWLATSYRRLFTICSTLLVWMLCLSSRPL